ncbi:hypothetical protein VTI74DRAFT_7979 [Chaetomium olivicolor]
MCMFPRLRRISPELQHRNNLLHIHLSNSSTSSSCPLVRAIRPRYARPPLRLPSRKLPANRRRECHRSCGPPISRSLRGVSTLGLLSRARPRPRVVNYLAVLVVGCWLLGDPPPPGWDVEGNPPFFPPPPGLFGFDLLVLFAVMVRGLAGRLWEYARWERTVAGQSVLRQMSRHLVEYRVLILSIGFRFRWYCKRLWWIFCEQIRTTCLGFRFSNALHCWQRSQHPKRRRTEGVRSAQKTS